MTVAQEVSSLYGKIGVDLSGAQKGLAQFDGMMNKAAGSLGGFAATAGKFALGATAAVATGAAALGGIAINAAATFEATISGIKSVSGATASEMAGISALALKLGADTKYSAAEAASGIEELIKGGVTIGDIMNGAADGMLNLAAAGGVDLPTAAEIASNALAMFNLKGKDMGHVADMIAGAANASSLSVTDFKFSIAAAGAVASVSGQSFDDLAVAIAIMGKSGMKGQDAGTSLKAMLMNLQPTTKTAKKQFEALGITVNGANNKFINTNGTFKSMAEIAGVLQDSMKGLTDAQRMQALETMFGSDAMRAGAVFFKEGKVGFDEMMGSMGKVTAASVAAERMNNLKGSLEQLKGSAETAAIAFGIAFLPMLKGVADGVTKMVNDALPAITAFGKAFAEWIPQALKTVTQAYGLFTENLADSRGVIYGLASAIGSVLNMFFDTDPAMLDGIAGAISGVVATVTSLVNAAIPWITQHGPVFVTQLQSLAAGAMAFAQQVAGVLVPALVSAGEWLYNNQEVIVGVVAALASFAIISTVVSYVTGLIAAFTAASAAISAAGGIITVIVAVLGGPITIAIVALSALIGLFAAAWTGNWFGIRDTLTAVWEGSIQPALASLVEWFGVNIPAAFAAVASYWDTTLYPVFFALSNWIDGNIIPVIKALADVLVAGLVLAWELTAGAITNVFFPAMEKVWSFISTNLGPVVRDLGKWLTDTLAPAADGLATGALQTLWNMLDKLGTIAKSLRQWLEGLSTTIGNIRLPDWATGATGNSGSNVAARASGGPVSSGNPYLVGERGPELFVPSQSGRIEPNAGSVSIVCQFYGPTDSNAARDGVLSAARSLGLGVA